MEYGIPKGPYFCDTPCFREYPRLFFLAYIKALRHAVPPSGCSAKPLLSNQLVSKAMSYVKFLFTTMGQHSL
jgi:hypothetical protein